LSKLKFLLKGLTNNKIADSFALPPLNKNYNSPGLQSPEAGLAHIDMNSPDNSSTLFVKKGFNSNS